MNKEEIVTLLQEGICEITFTKVNGETRQMPCTLKSNLLPTVSVKELREEKTRKINEDNLSVWCTDKNAWRSFKLENFISIRKLDD
jgi:hypothetical protein